MEDHIQYIERNFDGSPTIISETIKSDCRIDNTLISSYGTMIVDEKFINEILNEIDIDELPKKLLDLLLLINNKVINYFSSNSDNNLNREKYYMDNVVCDEDGMIIGTNISSLKGMNIAKCSEKSVAGYIILKELFNRGLTTRYPELVLSKISFDDSKEMPHAFILLNKDEEEYPTKHLLFDIENPTLVENKQGVESLFVGVYALNDDEYQNILNGEACTPTSVYEISGSFHEISKKRTFVSNNRRKTI